MRKQDSLRPREGGRLALGGNPRETKEKDMMEYRDIEWAITEPVDVTLTDNGTAVVIERVNGEGKEKIQLSFEDESSPEPRRMLINGEFVDLGDDFIAFVSIIDEYYEQGGEEGKTIRQQPYLD